jgi:voltage-gated potassium channel Kch
MSDQAASQQSVRGRVADGRVVTTGALPWSEGTEVLIQPMHPGFPGSTTSGHVIVAGFGLPGRCAVELLAVLDIPHIIVEQNPETVAAQRTLGRRIMLGDITLEDTLIRAELSTASMLALTIPDEAAVLRATEMARRLNPEVYIVARTNHSSKGMEAVRLGANEVVKAEEVVARRFRAIIASRLNGPASDAGQPGLRAVAPERI